MDELEFARRHFNSYQIKGAEIVPRLCPYCHGGQHGDKNTFALNTETHVFKCLRGSCGKQGHFSELLRDFGEQPNHIHTPPVKRSYTRPQPPKLSREGKAWEYILSRGISAETAGAFGVGGNDRGEVVFPYFETVEQAEANQPVFIKYRPGHKLAEGERKARREKDSKPILFGMHKCRPEQGMLFIFEGEFDCMAGWQAHGGNCVSVPSGCKDFTWMETCADFLSRFDRVAVIGDNDDPGKEMLRELAAKLECTVYFPDFSLYGVCKDANEIFVRYGSERLRQVMDTVKPAPVLGLLNLADVAPVNYDEIPRVLTGFQSIDYLTGGLYAGDLNIWTGRRGEGKSTILTQVMLEAVEQGVNVCAYSGEIPADRFKYTLCLQAAGSSYACERDDKRTGRKIQFVPRAHWDKINRWLDGKFWLYDNRIAEADEAESVLRVFEQAYRRYDCRVFLVDNIMTVRTCKRESDFYQAQADFALRLRKLAARLGICVNLVVHPRKTGAKSEVDNDDVGGSATLTNAACNVFWMKRLSDIEASQNGCDSTLRCTKNRAHGETGEVPLSYVPTCRRFVERGGTEKLFSWYVVDVPTSLQEEAPF